MEWNGLDEIVFEQSGMKWIGIGLDWIGFGMKDVLVREEREGERVPAMEFIT